jgi:hypothetical protein
VALLFTLKSYLKAKRRINGNSKISPCKNVIFIIKKKTPSKRNQNPSRYYYNSIKVLGKSIGSK